MTSLKVIFLIISIIYYANCSSAPTYSASFFSKYIDPTSAVLSIDTAYQDSCATRQAPGFVCMDCRVLARCIFRGNQWDTIALEACDEGQGLFCNPNEQRCSANTGPCHPGTGGGVETIFACSSSGIFPDPYNCQQYHMCFPHGPNLLSVTVLCGDSVAYNPVTNDCSLPTMHSVCSGNVFTCDYVGQMGAWPLNPNIYYMCMARSNGVRVLFPQIFRCPLGQVFSNDDCVPGSSGGLLPPGSNNNDGFICQRPGLFFDQSNCRSYFFCDGSLRSQRIMCPTGTYFNRMVSGCVRGTCV
ncbi:hypothetical protein ACKWTF_005255 [Chironomus riparius]